MSVGEVEPREPGRAGERYPMSREKLRWLCTFCEATGKRTADLLTSERGDVLITRAGALLTVVALRGLDFDTVDEKTPLLASLVDGQALTYDSLY